MARQHAEIALGTRHNHHLDVAGEDQPLRRHKLELQGVGHGRSSGSSGRPQAASAAICFALSTASSMGPTM